MRRLFRNFRQEEKGFTLIELLVVIAILGILAAIVVPNFLNLIGSGAEESACIEMRMVQTAVVAYAAENNGDFPTSVDGNTELDPYFIGGVASVLGNYSVTDGVVSTSGYPGTDAGCPD